MEKYVFNGYLGILEGWFGKMDFDGKNIIYFECNVLFLIFEIW